MRFTTLLLMIFFLLQGCSPNSKAKEDQRLYFDLQGFVNDEAKMLSRRSPVVLKTVSINGSMEKNKLKIADWKSEFSSLSGADINKTAWKGSFTVQIDPKTGSEHYSSGDQKINVKELKVSRVNGQISEIYVLIRDSNLIYTSVDTITYYPDSLYTLKKTQKISFLARKEYGISISIKN